MLQAGFIMISLCTVYIADSCCAPAPGNVDKNEWQSKCKKSNSLLSLSFQSAHPHHRVSI